MITQRKYNAAIEKMASTFPHLDFSDAIRARNTLNEYFEAMANQGFTRLVDDRVEEIERMIPGPEGGPDILIRIYMPKNRNEPGPGFINFHGGGFIFGDLEMEHPRCLIMAAEGGAVSVGVDYRLIPENPFPASVEDCYTALEWVVNHAGELKIDPSRIAIGGSSAGGNLTAAVTLMARDRGGPDVAFQMLFYPTLDDMCETSSMKNGVDTYIWNYQNSLDLWDHYVGKDRKNVSPYAAPARAKSLAGLPPAYVITCEHDPLRDEALLYAMRLMADGVQVELHNYPGTVHGFDLLTLSDLSRRAVQDSVEAFILAMAK